jgi:hypothetical protein
MCDPLQFLDPFVSTFEAGTHKMSGGEGYMKDLLGPEGCKNVT